MATRYVDSAATGANDGTSWANAFTTLAGAAAVDTAGDVIYVKSTHSESTAGAVTYDWAGTAASPTRIICVSDSNEPPTTMATGAVVAVTGASNLTLASSSDYLYVYGVRFKAGDSTNAADVVFDANGSQVYENCAFELGGNNLNSDFTSTAGFTRFIRCTFKSSHSGSSLQIAGVVEMLGCSIESGGTPGNPFFLTGTGCLGKIIGCDFLNLNSSANLTSNSTSRVSLYVINCKLPSSWSGSINGSSPGFGSVCSLQNSDSADTNYRLEIKTELGSVVHETTLVRTGGASNGTTTISWKMVSNADAEWNHQTLDTPEIVQWVGSTGSKTFTIEFLHDSATNLTDHDIWLEVQYLGTSGFPLASMVSDAAATYLTAAADQTDSSETWTTTGMSNPNTQKLSVTATVNEVGYVHAVVKLAKASYTVYIDPMVSIT